MLHTTIAFDNFVKFYLPHESDCKVLRRIECAIRGEELYRTFSSIPSSVAKMLFAVFDYLAWTLISTKEHKTIPKVIITKYELARAAIEQTQSDVAINGLAAFSDFARKYVFALAMLNSDYFRALPEESTHERVRAVCSYYHACQTDVFPRFVKYPKEPVTTSNLPSYQAQLPNELPFFLCVPNDPLLILCDTASVLLGA
jgi:hypothetical protein